MAIKTDSTYVNTVWTTFRERLTHPCYLSQLWGDIIVLKCNSDTAILHNIPKYGSLIHCFFDRTTHKALKVLSILKLPIHPCSFFFISIKLGCYRDIKKNICMKIPGENTGGQSSSQNYNGGQKLVTTARMD